MSRCTLTLILVTLSLAPLAHAHDSLTGAGGAVPNLGCDASQRTHDYSMAAGQTPKSRAVTGWSATLNSMTTPGLVVVSDSNTLDCNGDGVPGDFDGDYELGLGGGFFPFGFYAGYPICDYGITSHHSDFVNVVAGDFPHLTPVVFTVGIDSTHPSILISPDPEDDDGWECVTDGSITPDIDVDDQLITCIDECTLPWWAHGGDGGYWVWVNGVLVEGEDGEVHLEPTLCGHIGSTRYTGGDPQTIGCV